MAANTESPDPAGSVSAGPDDRSWPAGAAGRFGAGWRRFGSWRRSRPFWAGLLLIIAGAELLLIPLPMNSMGLILHIGIGGVLGILIGAVLIVIGLLLWFNPAQRIFYSIVAVLVAVAALIASNLGGFLIGTVLGVIGGSLGFAWTPLPPGTVSRRWWRRRATESTDLAHGHNHGTVVRGFALLPILALLAGLLHAGSAGQQQTSDPQSAATSCASPPPTALPLPTPSPTCSSPTPSATPSVTSAPGSSPSPGAAAGPSAAASASPSPSTTPSNGTAPPFAIATSQSTLTASSAQITGFAYDGLVSVRTATGSVQMMQFSASSLDLSGVHLAVSQGGTTITTTASALDLSGDVVLYATELSGNLVLAGAPVPVTITPNSPLSVVLQFLGDIGASQAVPLQMTNVTTQQPYTSANGMSASALQIS